MSENKAWYRLLKVIYILVWIIAFIIIGFITYLQHPYSSINYYKIGYTCNSGKSWEFYPTNSVYDLTNPGFTDSDEENVRKTCEYGVDYKNNTQQLSAPLPAKNYTLYFIYDNYGSSNGMGWALFISFFVLFIVIEGVKSAILYIIGIPVLRGGLLYLLKFLATFGKKN